MTSTTPLVSSWYAASGWRATRTATGATPAGCCAQRLGSLVSLLAYPFLIEPLIGCRRARRVDGGFGLLVACLAVGGAPVQLRDGRASVATRRRSGRKGPARSPAVAAFAGSSSAAIRAGCWRAVTNLITTDL